MKNNQILFFTFLFILSLTSCVKDEDGYSEFLQNFIDSMAIIDVTPIPIDKPCIMPENEIHFNDEVVSFGSLDDDYYYTNRYYLSTSVWTPSWTASLSVTFFEKPIPGNFYIIQEEYYPDSGRVNINFNYDDIELSLLEGDTVYVEKYAGGDYSLTFCSVGAFDDYYNDNYIISGNATWDPTH